MIEKI